MKYTIISLNDDRKVFKDTMRQNVGYEEVLVPAFNAHENDPVEALKKSGLKWDLVWGNAKRGELGVWISNYDRWELVSQMDEPLIVFEDDAVVDSTFNDKFQTFHNQLPSDWDFAALWVPENQRIDYLYDLVYERGIPRINGMRHPDQSLFKVEGSDRAALVYQGYGMVSLVYSPVGGQKLVALAKEYGITGPVDCWIYEQAHMGNLNGYAPTPDFADIVTYDWSAVSHVQLTEKAII